MPKRVRSNQTPEWRVKQRWKTRNPVSAGGYPPSGLRVSGPPDMRSGEAVTPGVDNFAVSFFGNLNEKVATRFHILYTVMPPPPKVLVGSPRAKLSVSYQSIAKFRRCSEARFFFFFFWHGGPFWPKNGPTGNKSKIGLQLLLGSILRLSHKFMSWFSYGIWR